MKPHEPQNNSRPKRPRGVHRRPRQWDPDHVAHEEREADAEGRDVGGAVLLDGEEVDDEDELGGEEDLYKEALGYGEAETELVGDEEGARDEAGG